MATRNQIKPISENPKLNTTHHFYRTPLNDMFNYDGLIIPTKRGDYAYVDAFLSEDADGYYDLTKISKHCHINRHNIARQGIFKDRLASYDGQLLIKPKIGNAGGTKIHPILMMTIIRTLDSHFYAELDAQLARNAQSINKLRG
jgi:hypothetical protein